MNRSLLLAPFLLLLAGCATTAVAGAYVPDAPVPASEPRAAVRLRVDLVRAQDCEEAFDLALYQSRAIELVEWDAGAGGCSDRAITIRYFSAKATRDDVLRAARAAAAKVDAAPPTNGEKP